MNYVFTIKKTDIQLIQNYYEVDPIIPDDSRILMIFKTSDVTTTIYASLKVMLQGPLAYEDYLFFSDLLQFEPIQNSNDETTSSQSTPQQWSNYRSSAIGSDEVGTGDFFGPVVVCSAYVEASQIKELEALGVRDSKKLSDETIIKLGPILQEKIAHIVLTTDNNKYNNLISQGFNMNKIKAYLHNHAIRKCIAKIGRTPDYVIIDQFCSPTLYFDYLKDQTIFQSITFLEKAESAHLSVAAASIIARYVFLEKINQLSESVSVRLPLGAGPGVDVIGQLIVKRLGESSLTSLSKTNFKNMERIIKRP